MALSNPLTRIHVEAVLMEQLCYAFMGVVDENIRVVVGNQKRTLPHVIDAVAAEGVYWELDILLAPHRWIRWPAN